MKPKSSSAEVERPLSEAKRRLLERWRRPTVAKPPADGPPVAGSSGTEEGRPSPAAPATPPPLSSAQERLWFLLHLEDDPAVYHMPRGYYLRGALDGGRFRRALQAVWERQDALRTTFPAAAEGGPPTVQVRPPGRGRWPVVDLSGLEPGDRDGAVRRLAETAVSRPFDLAAGPLFRCQLLRLRSRYHAFLVQLHHLVGDGGSFGVLMDDLRSAYRATGTGEPAPRPALQYGDFARGQRRWLEGRDAARDLDYWRDRLRGAPARLDLPTDRPRPERLTGRGRALFVRFPPTESERVRAAFGRTTPFMFLLTAFAVLLWRLTGRRDVVVGTPIAHREPKPVEELIGLFVNTLALRLAVPRGASGEALLQQARGRILEAFTHSRLPFEKLVEALKLPRDLRSTPLFQTFFTYRVEGDEMKPLAGEVEIRELPLGLRRPMFDLAMTAADSPRGLWGWLEYHPDLFDETTLRRWGRTYRRIALALAESPDLPPGELPLLAPEESHQLLHEWPDAPTPPLPGGGLVATTLAEQVAQRPRAVALEQGEIRWTYERLDERAGAWGRALRRHGVGPGDLVAVRLPRSPEMVAAFLGTWRAGAAYLPLDADAPAVRCRRILEIAGAKALVTGESSTAKDLATGSLHLTPRSLESVGAAGSDDDEAAVPRPTDPDDLAYVLFTSGSTGEPKGVMVRHGSLANHTDSARRGFGLTPRDRVLQLASPAFDTSAEEIYPCLTGGATLVLRESGDTGTGAEGFLALLAARRITVVDLPTAYWHELTLAVEPGGPAPPPSLRLVILGGERALAPRAAAWRRWAPGLTTLNTYGPTEGTIVATRGPLTDGPPEPLLGRPIEGVRALVLDRRLDPTPMGSTGELCLADRGLARGYLGRPADTARAFVPDPHGPPGARLYRTGDRARHRPDGALQFEGRLDDQVKIHGYRVELGAVEAALAALAEIEEAVVTADRDGAGQARLTAYVRTGAAGGGEGDLADTRRRLREELPGYMVPARWVAVEEFPRTPGGKVDRHRLPAADESAATRQRPFFPPRTDLERQIAEVWAQVLEVPRVSVEDNFFDLGGNSLLLMRAHGLLRSRLGPGAGLADLLVHPTIATFARFLSPRGSVAPAEPSPAPSSGDERLRGRDRLRLRRARSRRRDDDPPEPTP